MAPTADAAGPMTGRDRPVSKSYETSELAKIRASASQVAAIKIRDGPEPLILKVDGMGRHATFRDRGASAVLSIDDVELEFAGDAPVEAENQVEQDGFKNPYFRKRANSLVLKHQSKFAYSFIGRITTLFH